MGKMMKKSTTCILLMSMIFSLIGSSVAFAAETAATLRTSFPDVSISHWANKHISKLSLLGIVEGDATGFKPEDQVTQEQVITMAIRMIGLEDEANQLTTEDVLPFDVQSYAKKYISVAIDEKLIDIKEEVDSSKGSKTWGSKPATREWVSKIVVRAIGKKEEALSKANKPTTFKDNKDISASAIGYINEAAALGIVNGFEDGSFQPSGAVTRAQMATFLSRAEQYVKNPSDRVYRGVVVKVSNSRMTLQDQLGVPKEFTFQENTAFFSGKEDTKRLNAASISASNEVYVVHNNGVAYLVELTNDEVRMDSIEGKLLESNLSNLSISVEVKGEAVTYKINADVAVVNADGAGLSFNNLVKGSIIELKKNAIIKDANVSHIIVKREPSIKNIEALFISLAGETIKVMNKVNGDEETYRLASDAAIIWNGVQVKAADLYDGDTVEFVVVDELVQTMTITNKFADATDEGKLKIVDLVNKIVTIERDNGGLGAYALSEIVNVAIEGIPYANYNDLTLGDKVKVELKQNKVVRIKVKDRNVQPPQMATIMNYDPTNKLLTIQDEAGNPKAYFLTEKANIVHNSTSVSLQKFEDYFPSGKKIEITTSDNTILYIRLANTFEGKVSSITANQITILTANKNPVSVKINSNTYVELANNTFAKVEDVILGDSVKLILNSNQDAVGTIVVKRDVLFTTTHKNPTTGKITVQQPGTTTSIEITVDNSFSIVKKGSSQTFTMSDIGLNQNIIISYSGRTIEKITLLEAYLGKLTNVDRANNKISVTRYNGQTHELDLGKTFKVYRNTIALTNLDGLNVNERVDIAQDINGNYYISVLPSQKRSVQSYDVFEKEITFKKRDLSENPVYTFHENAYIHKGSETYNPNFLLENDEVTVYFLGEKIIEMEK